jgi:transketolase
MDDGGPSPLPNGNGRRPKPGRSVRTATPTASSAVPDAPELAHRIRRTVIEQSKRAHVGHIGSSLSIADIIAALFAGPLHLALPEDRDRDRFILSKGHAALALYAALHEAGRLTDRDLGSFCGDQTALGAHPEHVLRGIDFSTGSLGHGLSIGAGAALAARLEGSKRAVFVLVSDAECNEGSLWEAVMFAAHHQLSNLIAIVDVNGQQALGYTRDVLDLDPLAARWNAFGWDVHEIDGHDVDQMSTKLADLRREEGPPQVLLARTTFGKGVSYMESQIKWHYMPMSDEEYEGALQELEAARR